MKSNIHITYYNSYYYMELKEKQSFAFFNRFTNWLSAEFDLLLQEQLKNELIIYYPNGSIVIKHHNNSQTLTMSVKNKIEKDCIRIADNVLNSYSFLQSSIHLFHEPQLESKHINC
ncbi:protein of unknown function [Tenacibaculum sp. 190130A14a]